MANIKTIIDELETIATASTAINTFIFEEISSINDDIAKTYPALLVNSRSVNYSNDGFDNTYLPKKKIYTLQIFFLDLYKESEQSTTDKQTKYKNLELIADQYLAELKRRTIESYIGFDFTNGANGFEVDKLHNDSLVQVLYTITITAKQNCTVGTFNY